MALRSVPGPRRYKQTRKTKLSEKLRKGLSKKLKSKFLVWGEVHSTPSTNFLGVPALFGAQNLNLGLFYPRFGSNFGEIRSRTIEIDWNGLGPLRPPTGPSLGPPRSRGAQKSKVPRLSSNFEEVRPMTVEMDGNGLGALMTHPGSPMGSSRSNGAAQGHMGSKNKIKVDHAS